jgi:UDP-N-acetylmuramoylalanine--D-glutamate ligase
MERNSSGGAILDHHHAFVPGWTVDPQASVSALNLYLGQRFLILGLGVSGLAMVKWCVAQGASVVVLDTRPNPPGQAEVAGLGSQVTVAEPRMLLQFMPFDRICKSPGLAPHQVEEMLEGVDRSSLPLSGEADLFVEALDQLHQQKNYQPSIVGITGTNGKTTVTALTHHLVSAAGKTATVAGNIGPSLLDALSAALLRQSLPEVWVLELSSFQLADAAPMVFEAAVVLNVTEDHLDWHGSMDAYQAAKAKILERAQCRILNRDDHRVCSMVGSTEVRTKSKGTLAQASKVSFGGDVPHAPGDYGLEEAQGLVWLVRVLEADSGRKRNEPAEIHVQRLMPMDALRIVGRHNALNALAALALCSALQISMSSLLKALRTYAGEPHRVQSIAKVNGVDFIDDSKGTNTGATVAAINGMGPTHRLILILGGDGKGQDFSPLVAPMEKYAKAVVLIGKDGPAIGRVLSQLNIPKHECGSLQDAVRVAAGLAQPGDAVLLSPACASLDMFRNYLHRAEVFRASVQDLDRATLEAETGSVS